MPLGVDDRSWPLQALGRVRVAWTNRRGVEHAAMPALDQVHLADGELPLDVCSRSEGLSWVEASQQRRDRHIYSVSSGLIHEIARDRVG